MANVQEKTYTVNWLKNIIRPTSTAGYRYRPTCLVTLVLSSVWVDRTVDRAVHYFLRPYFFARLQLVTQTFFQI